MPSLPISTRPRVMRAALVEFGLHAVGHACRQCDYVLEGATELDAYHVRVGVHSEAPTRQ